MCKLVSKINTSKPAFSIIEIMAVLLIVSLGIIAMTNLAVQSIQAQTINRGSIVAHQLAQEGIEIVRQVRDTNWLQGENWTTGMTTGTYCLDYQSSSLRSVSGIDDCELYFTTDGWYYAPVSPPAGAVSSKFKRVLVINVATSSAQVIAQIEWDDRNKVLNYEVETELYDWY